MSGEKRFAVSGATLFNIDRRRVLKMLGLAASGVGLKGTASSVGAAEAVPSSDGCSRLHFPLKDPKGKIAFITGGSSGIGLGITRAFLAAGMKVAIGYRSEAHLQEALKELGRTEDDVQALKVDVTDRAQMHKAAAAVESNFGSVHVLVNNAGVFSDTPLSQVPYEVWQWMLDVNMNGVFNGISAFLPKILSHGEGGQIVSVSSMAGLIGNSGAYSAAKFAVVGMMEALRWELAQSNVGVSVCCPGLVRTNVMESSRNRPVGQGQAAFESKYKAEYLQAMKDPRIALDPLRVGELVLRGITHNDLYILTHAQHLQMTRDRHELIVDSMVKRSADPDSEQARSTDERRQSSPYGDERNRRRCPP